MTGRVGHKHQGTAQDAEALPFSHRLAVCEEDSDQVRVEGVVVPDCELDLFQDVAERADGFTVLAALKATLG